MNIGERITKLRKQHNMTQADLAHAIEASRTIVGNYERNANTPSVEAIEKLAILFDVSTDYLIGVSKIAQYDKEILKRIEAIEELDKETKEKLFFLIDSVVQSYKTKKAHE